MYCELKLLNPMKYVKHQYNDWIWSSHAVSQEELKVFLIGMYTARNLKQEAMNNMYNMILCSS